MRVACLHPEWVNMFCAYMYVSKFKKFILKFAFFKYKFHMEKFTKFLHIHTAIRHVYITFKVSGVSSY